MEQEIGYLIIGISIFMLFLIGLFLIIITISKKRKILHLQEIANEKIKVQQAQLEKKDAIIKERERIIADLHDEIGGGLSTIKLMTELALLQNTIEEKLVKNISDKSKDLAHKMNEIVWTLNHKNDSLQGLYGYIRQYMMQTLDDMQIQAKANIEEPTDNILIDGNKRRSLFLIAKEITNNIIKHSKANNANINISIINGILIIIVADDGIGFDITKIKTTGFGLSGLTKRVENLNGKINWESINGTKVTIKIPLHNLTTTKV
jgi:signal transduction histidine kinase